MLGVVRFGLGRCGAGPFGAAFSVYRPIGVRTFGCKNVSEHGHFSAWSLFIIMLQVTHISFTRNTHVPFRKADFFFCSLVHFSYDRKPSLWFDILEVLI